MQSMNIKL